MKTRSMISFDWAMKRLLRNKANFEVLEGFLSELLRRKIIIKNMGESEGNKTTKKDKTNRVDILVEADDSELVIIELQYDSVDEYFHRMVYGVSKSITEHIVTGESYSKVRKVYSVNIVYFDLGSGDDYVYHGFTNFKGLHTQSELQLSADQRQLYGKTTIGELYPEYYIIKVNGFNDVAKDTLDEWIYYLKNNRINEEFTAQGLAKARILLAFDALAEDEKSQYLRETDEKLMRDAEIRTSFRKGQNEGKVMGLEEGLEKGKVIGLEEGEAIGLEKGEVIGLEKGKVMGEAKKIEEVVMNCYRQKISVETIAMIANITTEQVKKILERDIS